MCRVIENLKSNLREYVCMYKVIKHWIAYGSGGAKIVDILFIYLFIYLFVFYLFIYLFIYFLFFLLQFMAH